MSKRKRGEIEKEKIEGNRARSLSPLSISLADLRISIVLLIAITIAAVAGTLVPQMPLGLTANTVAYNRWLELTYAKYGGRADLFHVLGLFDIFNTWWFRSLVGALLVNALACTLIRVRRLWRAARRNFPESVGWLGTLVSHVSFMLLVIGAVTSIGFSWRDEQVIVKMEEPRYLAQWSDSAGLRLVDFTVDRYPNGAPRDYRADVAIVENGEEVLQRTVRVNDPLTYRGATFYLLSYGPDYVELMAVHDPGYNIVIGAAGLMMVGMTTTLYTARRRWR